MVPPNYRLWVVHTKPETLDVVKRSIPDQSWLEMRHISTGDEFLQLCNDNIMNPNKLPHVVLLDFFLGGDSAAEVVPKFNSVFEAMQEYKPYLIAFSSMPNANEAMIALGVPWSVLNEKGKPNLPELTDLMGSKEKLAKHLGHM